MDSAVEGYLAELGVGEPMMTLLRKTPAASIRWLDLDEIKASKLATGMLDAAEPILAGGANGLDGRAFDAAAAADLLSAQAADRNGSGAILTLAYRRGGGALEMALTGPGGRPATASADWTATTPEGPPLVLKAAGDAARALLPRAESARSAGRAGSRPSRRRDGPSRSTSPRPSSARSSPKPAPDGAPAWDRKKTRRPASGPRKRRCWRCCGGWRRLRDRGRSFLNPLPAKWGEGTRLGRSSPFSLAQAIASS